MTARPGNGVGRVIVCLVALVTFSSPLAFVVPLHSGLAAPASSGRSSASDLRVRSERRAASFSTAAGPASSLHTSLPGFAASLLLSGACVLSAALRRGHRVKAPKIATRITKEDIEQLTVDDVERVAPGWRGKVSLGMARRNEQVLLIREQFGKAFAILTFNCHSMTVAEQRRVTNDPKIPIGVHPVYLKNSFVRVAVKGTPWEAWLEQDGFWEKQIYFFVYEEEDLRPTVTALGKWLKELNREAVLATAFAKQLKDGVRSAAGMPDGHPWCTGAMIRDDWTLFQPKDVLKLKDFPTKKELYAKIAGSIQMVTTKIAKGTKQLPQKIAVGTKKIVEKMEEEGKDTVGDVVA